MALLSPRTRTLTRDVLWSFGAAVVAVSLMGSASGLLTITGFATHFSGDGATISESSYSPAFAAEFDAFGDLTDNLPLRVDDPDSRSDVQPEDTGTGTVTSSNDAGTTGAAEAQSESTDASPPATDRTADQTPASQTSPTGTSAERTSSGAPLTPAGPTPQQQIETIADRLPFNWRAAGVTLKAECAPNRSHCRWGLYVVSTNTVWVGTDAFANPARLFYVVAHELAHAWQFSNDPHARMNDLADWGYSGVDGLEAAADCLAQAWGATINHYWNCPSDAQRHMTNVFNGS